MSQTNDKSSSTEVQQTDNPHDIAQMVRDESRNNVRVSDVSPDWVALVQRNEEPSTKFLDDGERVVTIVPGDSRDSRDDGTEYCVGVGVGDANMGFDATAEESFYDDVKIAINAAIDAFDGDDA